ncbi:MAG TPA: hypothetical protein VF193_05010 [Steroidobacter sp.]
MAQETLTRQVGRSALLVLMGTLASACGGGGGGGGGVVVPPPPPSGETVTVSGVITFDRIPFSPQPDQGLTPNSPVRSPARQVVVEAIDPGRVVLASTVTDLSGNYSLEVPAQRDMRIRAKAQMLKTDAAPTWNFAVRNNMNGDALWALESSLFNSGSEDSTHNLNAGTGWGGSSYTGTRAAAPFAILDTVFQAKELILSASPNAVFPPLDLFWNPTNRQSDQFCPDNGDIGTTSYVVFGQGGLDSCNVTGVSGIYVLGNFTVGDTDEFDQHVIAHEFGHYVEHRFSRSDSIGGDHGFGDKLDLRVAFGEGWGNAYSAMVLSDPLYRDSAAGISQDFNFSLEDDSGDNEGWYSEFSVGEILWDVFDTDSPTELADTVSLGFEPIFMVMTGRQIQTAALTSIFSFADALIDENGAEASGIRALLTQERIFGTDEFGAGETNSGGDGDIPPIYIPITLNAPTPALVCSRSDAHNTSANKLGNRRFFVLDNPSSRLVSVQVNGTVNPGDTNSIAATDPDVYVFRQGELVNFGDSADEGVEVIDQFPLQPGRYVIEVYDFDVRTAATDQPRCMTVQLTGI